MTADMSFWSFIINASVIVKCVMLTLFFASIASWTIIVERARFYKQQWQEAKQFETRFWSGIGLNELLQTTGHQESNAIAKIFTSGFKTFMQFQKTGHHSRDDSIVGAQRAMQIAECRAVDELEKPLSLLATIGSISPIIGLFGTVLGVITAFQGLGTVQQASIAAVAPGISEALITTAIGLFAAIPAVIAYNRFSQQVVQLQNHYEAFSGELTNILHRQANNGE
ncbi:MAG: protein TolQ [Gammaproteobacteria bacterium RIFCSPHIGHO2_12_FULL_40_19]|nr:MAG: protein TolQ [Gammaproteobacteria bacterium RIFCSPHIGHO2_12_FULL_40_19]